MAEGVRVERGRERGGGGELAKYKEGYIDEGSRKGA